MSIARPSDPDRNNVRTYYQRPLLDRLTGHYTVEWENAEGVQMLRVHNRFRDMEGNAPSLASLMRLPSVLSSYRAARKCPILPEPVPFIVWDAIRFLRRELRPGMRVLEIGGGNSTLWFLKQGAWVTTIEHSPEWVRCVRLFAEERLGRTCSGRLDCHVEEGADALGRIASMRDRSFDVILVDSTNARTYRADCVAAARDKARTGGWLVLDDSDHPSNWPACKLMSDRERIRFTGYAPMSSVVCQTSAWRM